MREISPSLIISVTCLVVILCLDRSEETAAIALCLSSLPFALGTACTYTHLWWRLRRVSFFTAAGLILGSLLCFRILVESKRVYAGLPDRQVVILQGYVCEDSRRTVKGPSLHTLNLTSVTSGSGSISQARGRAVLFDRRGRHFYAGELLQAWATIRLEEEGCRRYYTGSVRRAVSEGFSSFLFESRSRVLAELVLKIERLGHPVSSLFTALFLGIRDEIPEEMSRGFVATGTSHFLALSGLHVGIVYLFVLLLLKPIPGSTIKWIIGSGFLLFYLFLVGPRTSLLRAVVTAVVTGLTALLDRDPKPLNLLGLVLLVILIVDPASAFSIALQLSFLSVAGILVFGRALSECTATVLPAVVRVPLAFSMGAQLTTVPVVLNAFGVYYPVGILVTTILIPLITAFIWAGLLLLVLLPLSSTPLWELGRTGVYLLYRTILHVNAFFSRVPGLTREFLPYYWYFLGAAFGLLLLRGRIRALKRVSEVGLR
jgi:competence protein ComEC